MNTFLKVLVFLALLIAAMIGGVYYYVFHAGDSKPLDPFVPSDSFAYIEISNTRQTTLDLARNPHNEAILETGRIMGSLALGAMGGPKQIDFNELDYEALVRAALPLNRQVCFWIPNVDWSKEKPRIRLPLMIAHFQGDADSFEADLKVFTDSLARATQNAEIKADFEWSKSEWNGAIIRKLNVSGGQELPDSPVDADGFNPSWTLWKGRLVASLSEESLKDYLNSLVSEDPTAVISNDEAYKRAKDNDFIALMDLSSVMTGIEKLQDYAAAASGLAPEIPINELLEATGILEIDTITYGLNLSSDDLQAFSSVSFGENKGMLNLISNPGESPVPHFAPLGVGLANSLNLDFGELVLFIKDLVLTFNPDVVPMYEMNKPMADQYLGRDVEEFLDSVFANEIHAFYELATASSAPEQNPINGFASMVIAIGLDEAQPLKDLMTNRLAPMLSESPQELSERRIEDQTYFELSDPGNPVTPILKFCTTDDYALIGMEMSNESVLFDQTIELLSNGQPGIFQEPSIASAIDSNDPDIVGVALADMEKYLLLVRSLANTMSAQARTSGEITVASAIDSINWSAFDSLTVYAVTTTRKTEHEFISSSRIVQK